MTGGTKVPQVIAVIAVGAAAVSLVAGLGVYLYVRFTQHRWKPPGGEERPPGPSGDPPTAG